MIEQDFMKKIMWESAEETFKTMVPLPLKKLDSQDEEPNPSVSLTCSITFGGQIQGIFSVQCPVASAEQMAKAMLMMDDNETIQKSEVCDALGEIVNMILGGIKSRLNIPVPDMQISIPTTIKGTQVRPVMGKSAARVELKANAGSDIIKLITLYKAKKQNPSLRKC